MMALKSLQKRDIAMYAARGLSGNEIRIVTQIPITEIRAYCEREGIVLVHAHEGRPRSIKSEAADLRERWAGLIGPMKARLQEAILYDVA
jgi:hypothetical protein